MTTLRNGAEVHQAVVMTTTLALNALEQRGMLGVLAVYDLLSFASSKTAMPLQSRDVLTKIGLLQEDGSLHRDTAAVVLSSYEFNGLDFNRIHPIS